MVAKPADVRARTVAPPSRSTGSPAEIGGQHHGHDQDHTVQHRHANEPSRGSWRSSKRYPRLEELLQQLSFPDTLQRSSGTAGRYGSSASLPRPGVTRAHL